MTLFFDSLTGSRYRLPVLFMGASEDAAVVGAVDGLRMVQLATEELKRMGYDLSYIHYTSVGHWYARLGYETVVRWNRDGVMGN